SSGEKYTNGEQLMPSIPRSPPSARPHCAINWGPPYHHAELEVLGSASAQARCVMHTERALQALISWSKLMTFSPTEEERKCLSTLNHRHHAPSRNTSTRSLSGR